ncbi:MAG: cytochrome bc complex cytochrome b subunit, partial [Planctomycetota bacterium]
MRVALDRLAGWLDERWDGPSRLRSFLSKPVPRNVSWLHTLGSLLVFYLLLQVVTGVLMALYYSPSPDHAHASVRYVVEELSLGSLVYSLHRWGSGFLIVTAFLHFVRSYFLAAYKKPRELVWITGVLLGLLLTLFTFTGQLLPYDQRGYWATVVGIRIASGVPVLGNAVHSLLTGGYGDIGAATISRFFIAHVCVLPLLLVGLLGLHLALLQKAGSAGPLAGSPEPYRSFSPGQLMKDVLVSGAGAVLLFLVATFTSIESSGPASPEAGGFLPKPEWYFYSHFEILKLLPANLQVLGTFVLPNVLIAGALLLPFLDRGPERSFAHRKALNGIGILAVLSIVGLTGIWATRRAVTEPP